MSSMTMTSARMIRLIARPVVSSARWRRTRAPRCSRLNQETLWPASIAAWPSASRKWVLPVPDGPHTTRFSWRSTHSRVRSARWVGAGIDERVSSQTSKVLPVGNPAALRRARIEDACRPASSSASSARMASAGSQRCALAVASSSGAAARMCGQPQLAEQVDDLVDRGARRSSVPSEPSQAPVPGCSEWISSARRRCTGRVGGQDRGQIAFGEPAERGGVAERPVDPLGAVEAGEGDRFGHLHLHPAVPAGGGFDQPAAGRRRRWPGTRPRPRCVALGWRASGPSGRGG